MEGHLGVKMANNLMWDERGSFPPCNLTTLVEASGGPQGCTKFVVWIETYLAISSDPKILVILYHTVNYWPYLGL